MKCACLSSDAHNCWALRYHGHTGISELTVDREGGPCECACHEIDKDYDDWDDYSYAATLEEEEVLALRSEGEREKRKKDL